jgi:hypothetical protein
VYTGGEEKHMDEKVMIEFTWEEFDEILKYQETLQNATVQSAILNAIRVALYDAK